MTLDEALAELSAVGTAQNRKIYGRHGVEDPMYGVSYAHQRRLAKAAKSAKSGVDLARQLWATGNHDARILATMVADPERLSDRELDDWVGAAENYVLSDALSGMLIKDRRAQMRMETWTEAEVEWLGRIGWNLLARIAMTDSDLPDDYFLPYLETVEREIHRRKNRVRDAMNSALIAIGLRGPALEKRALAAAAAIRKVEVDYGQTGCKTSDAARYIAKAKAHRAKQRAKKRAS